VALVNSKGEAYTSYANFAIAMLDEIEHPEHRNERYAVVSES
jgi:putative NADH-flavin reductase